MAQSLRTSWESITSDFPSEKTQKVLMSFHSQKVSGIKVLQKSFVRFSLLVKSKLLLNQTKVTQIWSSPMASFLIFREGYSEGMSGMVPPQKEKNLAQDA